MPLAQVVLARVVRAVGEPEADDRRADLARDLDALEAVLERLAADAGSGWQKLPSRYVVVLEEVRVDRADPDALAPRRSARSSSQSSTRSHGMWIATLGQQPGQPVDERGVGDPLVHGARRARPREDVEARAGVAVAPGRRLDLELPELGERRLERPSALVRRSRRRPASRDGVYDREPAFDTLAFDSEEFRKRY